MINFARNRGNGMTEVVLLKREIYEMQKQLQNAFIKIKDLYDQLYELNKGLDKKQVKDINQLEFKF